MVNPETDKTGEVRYPQSPIVLMDGKFRCEVDGYVFEGFDYTGVDAFVLTTENMLDDHLSDIIHDVILDIRCWPSIIDAYDGIVGKIIFVADAVSVSEM
jgi:hypothetical protein